MLESFASPEEIDAMMKRMEQLLNEFDCSSTSIFSTKNQVLYSILINQFHNFEFFIFIFYYMNSIIQNHFFGFFYFSNSRPTITSLKVLRMFRFSSRVCMLLAC